MSSFPSALLVLLVAFPAVPIGAEPGPAIFLASPEGTCDADEASAACEWRFQTEPLTTEYEMRIPVFPQTLATITVYLRGRDFGWAYSLGPESAENWLHYHERGGSPGEAPASESVTHILFNAGEPEWRFTLFTGDWSVVGPASATVGGNGGLASEGLFLVTYSAEPLPRGSPPGRPAATRDDPHLLDARGDAVDPHLDLRAAWLGDAWLGDDLLDAHLAVESLADVPGTTFPIYSFEFAVLEAKYHLEWRLWRSDGQGFAVICRLREIDASGVFHDRTDPMCLVDGANSTLTAIFPERSVGAPADGVPFTGFRATSRSPGARSDECVAFCSQAGSLRVSGLAREAVPPEPSEEDAAEGDRYAFALGGPPVWDRLNPRLALPPPDPRPWFTDPLSSENLPDTLQVGGAATATGAFAAGALLVRRQRRRTRRLLDEVDAVAARHETNTKDALLALGRLELNFAQRLRRGRINETQYQLAAQRIAAAATRFALRRELGLDDGAPGEGDGEPGAVRARERMR